MFWSSSNYIWLQIIFRSCVNETTLFSFFILVPRATRLKRPRDQETTGSGDENAPSFDRSCVKKLIADRFASRRPRQTWWSNEKTIIELGYRKISRFVSVSQIDQLFASAFDWIGGGFVWPTRKWVRGFATHFRDAQTKPPALHSSFYVIIVL